MKVTESFNKNTDIKDKKVIIYGAGRYGELAFYGLKALGISVDYFVDRALYGKKYLGIEVLSPDSLEDYTDEIFLVASLNYFQEIYYYLKSIDVKFIYDILDLIKLDYDETVLSEYSLDEKHNSTKYENVINNIDSNKLIINHVELVLTEKCSLRCKDCANFMQYYKKPEDLEVDEVIRAFDNFINTIDGLMDLRLLGGEPFLYKDIDKIIHHYASNEKIKRITIYTNSTILPSAEVVKSLENKKVYVHMSNYGTVSRKLNDLESLFSVNKIQYYVHKYDKWLDVGQPVKHSYSEDFLKNMYRDCIMAKCLSFYRGCLYLCPRAAHGERLEFFKNPDTEFVDFNSNSNDWEVKRACIKKLLDETRYIEACRYCNGSSSRSKEIAAAVQMKI